MKRKVTAAAGGIAGAFILSATALAQSSDDVGRYGWGPHMMGWGGGWGGMIFGPIFMILVLVLVIAVAVIIVRSFGGAVQPNAPHRPTASGPAALDILKERFARGEIDKDEYEERRRVLSE